MSFMCFVSNEKIRKPFSLRIFLAEREGFGNLCCAKLPALGAQPRRADRLKTCHRQVFFTAITLSGSNPRLTFFKKKKSVSLSAYGFSGGKRGIRTLGGFMAHTRFPVVRLRPAQPSFHLYFKCASTALVYHTGFCAACQHLFFKFMQKNPAPGSEHPARENLRLSSSHSCCYSHRRSRNWGNTGCWPRIPAYPSEYSPDRRLR